jgi:hypothetical protein
MGKVVTAATISLDGYIAGPNETGFERLFSYFATGDHEIPTEDPNISIKLGEADYHFMRDFWASGGAFVCHVEDWVPQRPVTATGPNPLPR